MHGSPGSGVGRRVPGRLQRPISAGKATTFLDLPCLHPRLRLERALDHQPGRRVGAKPLDRLPEPGTGEQRVMGSLAPRYTHVRRP